jgi:glycerophosphoryl diester phosphodiesterase
LKNITFFIGHRGTRKDHEENTLDAFEAAFDSGANYIEFDVRRTKDNELVVFHDSKVDRITDSKGYLRNYSFFEISQMRFNLSKSKIPSFNEVLKLFRNRIKFMVELKEESIRDEVMKSINSHNLLKDCIISGRNLMDLEKIKRKYLDSRVCYNITKGKGLKLKEFLKQGKDKSLLFAPDFISLDSKMITEEFIEICHENSIFALSWNFIGYKNPIGAMKAIIEKGIDGILFDDHQNIPLIKSWLQKATQIS